MSTRTASESIYHANRHRIRVFTIGLGTTYNAAELEQVAVRTGGRFFQAREAGQLTSIYQEIATILYQGFQECVITYQPSCADGVDHTVDLQLRDYCGGSATGSKSYRAPLDSTTIGSVKVSLDSVVAPVPGAAVVPLRIDAISNPSLMLPPFEATITFDSSKLAYDSLRTSSPYELDASLIEVTPVPGGIRLKTLAPFARTIPVLKSLVFTTKAGLTTSPCVVGISDLSIGSACVTAFPADGLVTGIVLPPPAITVSASTVDFGWVMVDSTSLRQLTVSNTGGSVLRILAQDVTGGDASLFHLPTPLPAELAPAASADIIIAFTPKPIGAKGATLSFRSNDPVHRTLDIQLLGNATTTSVAQSPAVPEQPVIRSAYPNPLRHTTTLRVELPRAGEGSILIHDNLGRLVRTQTTGLLGAGTNTIPVSARDLAPGTYRVTLVIDGVAGAPALLVRY